MPASDWSDLCPFTIVWERKTGADSYGKPTYAAPVSFAPPTGGRRVYKTTRVPAGPAGQAMAILSTSQIWILATPAVRNEDLVYVQGDTAPFPIILAVQITPDEDGPLFTKIFFGSYL